MIERGVRSSPKPVHIALCLDSWYNSIYGYTFSSRWPQTRQNVRRFCFMITFDLALCHQPVGECASPSLALATYTYFSTSYAALFPFLPFSPFFFFHTTRSFCVALFFLIFSLPHFSFCCSSPFPLFESPFLFIHSIFFFFIIIPSEYLGLSWDS